MSKARHVSETPATRMLRQHAAVFTEHPYEYEEHGGTAMLARATGPTLERSTLGKCSAPAHNAGSEGADRYKRRPISAITRTGLLTS